jgi:hypothetical protein
MENNKKINFEISNLQIIDDGILNSLGLETAHNFSESNFSESNFVSNVKLDLSSAPTNANIDLSFEGDSGKAKANHNAGRFVSINGIYKKQGFFKEGTIKNVVQATTVVFKNERGLHKGKAIIFADGTASNPAKWDKIGSSHMDGEEHANMVSNVKLDLSTANNASVDLDFEGEEHANMVSNVKLDLSSAPTNANIDLGFEGNKEKCSCGNSNCSGCDGSKGCGCGCGSSNCSGK